MNLERFDELLNKLNLLLENDDLNATIYVYGGYALAIHGIRNSTMDIDGIFEPKMDVYKYVKQIAEEENIPKDWINDGIKGFINDKNEVNFYKSYSNIDIYVASKEYLLYMKLLAISNSKRQKDIEDLFALIESLEIKTFDEFLSIVYKYIDNLNISSTILYEIERSFK